MRRSFLVAACLVGAGALAASCVLFVRSKDLTVGGDRSPRQALPVRYIKWQSISVPLPEHWSYIAGKELELSSDWHPGAVVHFRIYPGSWAVRPDATEALALAKKILEVDPKTLVLDKTLAGLRIVRAEDDIRRDGHSLAVAHGLIFLPGRVVEFRSISLNETKEDLRTIGDEWQLTYWFGCPKVSTTVNPGPDLT